MIHRTAAEGFAAGAANYASGRPEYPPEILAWLKSELGLHAGKTAIDLGAGTGKFTRALLASGASIVAVEPVLAMREQLQRHLPQTEVRNGTADAIPFPDASVDAVVCAQSFHWFATPQALNEIRRVLKTGGALGLVWNVRDQSVDWVAALNTIMKPHEGDAPRYHSQKWRALFPAEGFGLLREHRVANMHTGPPEQIIVERILSVSFIAALATGEKERVATQLRQLVASHPQLAGRSKVNFPYETMAFATNKL
jgi:SAM-dependent methyltransferase